MGNKMEIRVSEILRDVGVPASLLGYHYLVEAIMLAATDRKYINDVTKELYPCIGKQEGTSPSRVERCIRNAVETAFVRGNPTTLHKYFGYTVSAEKGKATNSEFIATIAERVRLEV